MIGAIKGSEANCEYATYYFLMLFAIGKYSRKID